MICFSFFSIFIYFYLPDFGHFSGRMKMQKNLPDFGHFSGRRASPAINVAYSNLQTISDLALKPAELAIIQKQSFKYTPAPGLLKFALAIIPAAFLIHTPAPGLLKPALAIIPAAFLIHTPAPGLTAQLSRPADARRCPHISPMYNYTQYHHPEWKSPLFRTFSSGRGSCCLHPCVQC